MTEQDEAKRMMFIDEISHYIAIAGRCSKAFTCRKNMQDEGVVDIFLELMILFISLVSSRNYKAEGKRKFFFLLPRKKKQTTILPRYFLKIFCYFYF